MKKSLIIELLYYEECGLQSTLSRALDVYHSNLCLRQNTESADTVYKILFWPGVRATMDFHKRASHHFAPEFENRMSFVECLYQDTLHHLSPHQLYRLSGSPEVFFYLLPVVVMANDCWRYPSPPASSNYIQQQNIKKFAPHINSKRLIQLK